MVVYNMNYNILEVKEMPFTMKGYPEKSERLVSSVIERRNQSIRRRELRTIPYSNNGKNRGG